MPQEDNHGAAAGTEQSGKQQNGAEADGADGGEGTPPPVKAPQFVTPEILTGVLDRKTRTDQENLKKQFESFGNSLETKLAQKLEEALSKATPPPKAEGGKGSHGESGAAILELEKKAKDLEARLQMAEKRELEAKTRERDFKFRTKLEAALARNKCTDVRAAYLVLKEEPMTFDDQSEKITIKVKDTQFGIGDVELDIDTYIKTTFAEDIMPYVFQGKVRPGAPAGGDNGAGGSGPKGGYKESDIARMTPEQYQKERPKIEEALRAGKVVSDVGGPIRTS